MRKISKALAVLSVLPLAFALQGCGGGDSKVRVAAPVPGDARVIFDLAAGADGVPFPADLFFQGTVDGSINIPGKLNSDGSGADLPPLPALADPQTALNTMDGFGTTSPIVLRFNRQINPATASGGVRVFKADTSVTDYGSPAGPIARGALAASRTVVVYGEELTYGVDFIVVPLQTNLFVLPLKPLIGRAHV